MAIKRSFSEMFKGVDLAKQAAAENNIDFVLLDIPNLLGGLMVEDILGELGYFSICCCTECKKDFGHLLLTNTSEALLFGGTGTAEVISHVWGFLKITDLTTSKAIGVKMKKHSVNYRRNIIFTVELKRVTTIN